MVDDRHTTSHVTRVGCCNTRILDQRSGTCPRVNCASLAEAGNHCFASVEHLLNLIGGDRQLVWVICLEVRRADDAHRVVRNDDVAVGWPDAAVEHRLGQAEVHCDHDSGAGDDVNAVAVSHRGNLTSPGATTVQNKLTFNANVFAGANVVDDDCADAVTFAFDLCDLVVGHHLCAVSLSGTNCTPDHLPAVDGAVEDLECTLELGVKTRLTLQCLGDADFLRRHLCRGSALEELICVFFVVLRGDHEQATGCFNCV